MISSTCSDQSKPLYLAFHIQLDVFDVYAGSVDRMYNYPMAIWAV